MEGQAADVEEVRRRRWPTISLGVCGFGLSVTLALISAFYALRGSEVVVRPVEDIVIYRDGQGANSILNVAVRITMINAADGAHGDVLMEARLSPADGLPSFGSGPTVRPLFMGDAAAAGCDRASRCVVQEGLVVIEQPDDPLDIAGGKVRAVTLAFPITTARCVGAAKACQTMSTFGGAVDVLSRRRQQFAVTLDFFSDGKRRLVCETGRLNVEYLVKYGWSTLPCRTSSVSGVPWL